MHSSVGRVADLIDYVYVWLRNAVASRRSWVRIPLHPINFFELRDHLKNYIKDWPHRNESITTMDETIKAYVENKGCILISHEVIKKHLKMKIISSCGHETEVYYSNFKYKETGVICKACTMQRYSRVAKSNGATALDIENEGIHMLRRLLSNEFDFDITREGCLADIIIKPKSITTDLWYGVQLKTTRSLNNQKQYCFKFYRKEYPNCIILCNVLSEERIWCIPNDYKLPKLNLNIGSTNCSKYASFEIDKGKLVKNMMEKIQHYTPYPAEYWNKSTVCYEKENYFVKIRETKMPFLEFTRPPRNQLCYDFLVNGFKVQEKSISIANRTYNKMAFTLKKSDGNLCSIEDPSKTLRKYKAYSEGDNDYYWLWCMESPLFYIIPERVLLDNNIIGTTGKGNLIIPKKSTLSWIEPYTFDINSIDESKIKSFFHVA